MNVAGALFASETCWKSEAISWILPQTTATKTDHRKQTEWPSERLARTRIFGEGVNDELRRLETHTAYAVGLGTFGLSDGLITRKGKAHRAGSVIANLVLSRTKRPYKDRHAYCLFYTKRTCGACIKRCPARAITESGHDKEKCLAYLDMTRAYVESHYGFKGYGCCLCQVGVPCESHIPEGIEIQ